MFRRATTADVSTLCELRKLQLLDEGLAPIASIDEDLAAYFEHTLANNTLIGWVAEEEGEIVATAALVLMPFPPTYANPVGTRGYVTNMYTAPDFRGRGIATRLLGKLLDEAAERGVHKLLLSASEMGKPVYHRCGFRENGCWMELDV